MISKLGTYRIVDEWEKEEGAPWPLGATWVESQGAYNFALFSRHATNVTLLLYREEDPKRPVHEYPFHPIRNKTGLIWHCLVPVEHLRGATLYGYRVDGPQDPSHGQRFDPLKVLLDPFAPSVFFPPGFSRQAASRPGPNDGKAPLAFLPPRRPVFDWNSDIHPRHTHDCIVYELHVKGFTARANSGVSPENRGTFAGLKEKIPYLKDLGITVVELLPIHQFDPQEGNYWGYMTLNFFSPHRDYAAGDPVLEFREMVKAFHQAGLEVWLDVVYNHTSEAGPDGPTYSYRGIDNMSYYLVRKEDGSYLDETGCGNTTNCANPIVRALILSSLEYWAEKMHVDGFRFDLASIFTRTADGSINTQDPPLIAEIGFMAYLHDLRLVAEAWDINCYLLGRSFPGLQWRQWNGKFRDDVRSFVRGDSGKVGALMQRLYGSDDLFPEGPVEVYRPHQSVNFVTAHDGFCLYDLVSYNEKHNEANGHGNTDGTDDNLSWNCGWEGDIGAPREVLDLRRRQIRNFCCMLMLANGTPMFCAGDEFMNTQLGNNNPYNQDNEITWLNWDLLEQNRDMFRFFKLMIAFRKAHPSIGRSRYWREDVRWYGPSGGVDWTDRSYALAYFLSGSSVEDSDLYVMINGDRQDLLFTIQEGQKGDWLRMVDTSLASPKDIMEPGEGVPVRSLQYSVKARSVVVLERPA
ncbi:MAG: glycogen-debranching protein [Deltaproteobacteria bacterium]|nr:glycogen-debranching protein [Deltaproteobacteria bacterium]